MRSRTSRTHASPAASLSRRARFFAGSSRLGRAAPFEPGGAVVAVPWAQIRGDADGLGGGARAHRRSEPRDAAVRVVREAVSVLEPRADVDLRDVRVRAR